jgi:hypothetical protein
LRTLVVCEWYVNVFDALSWVLWVHSPWHASALSSSSIRGDAVHTNAQRADRAIGLPSGCYGNGTDASATFPLCTARSSRLIVREKCACYSRKVFRRTPDRGHWLVHREIRCHGNRLDATVSVTDVCCDSNGHLCDSSGTDMVG